MHRLWKEAGLNDGNNICVVLTVTGILGRSDVLQADRDRCAFPRQRKKMLEKMSRNKGVI